MLLLWRSQKLSVRLCALGQKVLLSTQNQLVQESEYTDVANYPDIKDTAYEARMLGRRNDWHEEICTVPTIEEKMIKINMPRYYGYQVVDLNDHNVPYNSLAMMQHYTRTHVESMPLQKTGEETENKLEAMIKTKKAEVVDALEFAHDFFSSKYSETDTLNPIKREEEWTQLVVDQVNRTLLQTLSSEYTHLKNVLVDYKPRHEAFWTAGGVVPSKKTYVEKLNSWRKKYASKPVDRMVQYSGSPYIAIRHRQQLPPWKTEEDYTNLELATSLPRYNFDARTLGYLKKYQHGSNIAGHWPDSRVGFGLLSIHSRSHLQEHLKRYGEEELLEAIKSLALQASFGWLLAQANNNGFNTYNEITYPMNTQTIITNGREWSFFEFQLNTLLIHSDKIDTNPRINNCRGTMPLKLYDEISTDGKCIGFNDDTLMQLLRFYINEPCIKRSLSEQQPYVNSSHRRIADYEDEEKRIFLEKVFKHLYSHRPRHLELPEIYLWERIYKIYHNTRPMDARRRFFELGINPWRRRLDEHAKVYVPKVIRPLGPKNKTHKFKNTYYP